MSIGAVGSSGSYGFIDRMAQNAMDRTAKKPGAEEDLTQIVAKILKKEDANSDGSLTASETKLDKDLFSKFDSGSDGKLTADELKAGLEDGRKRIQGGQPPMGPPPGGPPPMGPPPRMDASKKASSIMDSADANGDSTLSIAETGLSASEFKLLDTNGDGKVSVEEMAAGVKAREDERALEMAATAQDGTSTTTGASNTKDAVQSLLQILSQNKAATAYGGQGGYSQSSSITAQNLTISG